ncbi:FKBP-type peptidyl-prolyl cis-trans isomerase [Aquiflexum lacus]|uniref:FKBP-type peptidyl-prolyl cis-trans isomerase n=1 Tax=Aquiflexum lacus TaxID=2483805 RepID=UPI00189332B4|nr:FKBP-type peptidyl-prolyl cis-trans isomerase [Aquiflexum lacus]
MKRLSLVLFSIIIAFSSCISDSENDQIIFERNLVDIENYLADNPITSVKEFNDPTTGIRILWQEVSESGELANIGDTLWVDYSGKLLNNFVFDTSVDSVARQNNIFNPNRDYEPFVMLYGLTGLIVGFEFALSKMEEGDIATVLMPSLYGYGGQGQGSIPPNAPLLFELNLLELRRKD